MTHPTEQSSRPLRWRPRASLGFALILIIATTLWEDLPAGRTATANAEGISHTITNIHYTLDFSHPTDVLIGAVAFDVSLPTPAAVRVSFNTILPFYYPCQLLPGGVRWQCNLLTGPPVILATVTQLLVETDDPSAPPTISGSRTPAANAFGWNNTPVAVKFECTDNSSTGLNSIAASGAAFGTSTTSPLTVTRSTDGAALAVTGVCKDNAGNLASATVSGINIDQVKPTITATATANGDPYSPNTWTNKSVEVTFACTDDRSGVDLSSVTAPITVSTEGVTSAVSGSCKDKAGNQSTTTFGPIKIDKTAPRFTSCKVSPSTLWPPNHKMHDITVTISLAGGGSPVAFVLTSVTSNEPDNGLGDGDTANDIQGWTIGTPDVAGQLRAERSGTGAGRVYTLIYTATDQASNAASCTLRVTAPHDQGR